MQNVSFKDMYNLSLHQNKYNGLLSHSSRASKKDRKGCKKGKIETILKNKMVNACNRLAAPIPPSGVSSGGSPTSAIKKVLSYNTVPKTHLVKHEPDDPYTFTDQEPTYHNPAGGNAPGPPGAPGHATPTRREPQTQILKNIMPTPRSPLHPIKKEPPTSSPVAHEKIQNTPPLPATPPPPPSIFKMPLVSDLKHPPKRRKSTSSPSSKMKTQVKQEKSDSGAASSSKLSRSKDRDRSSSESGSNVLSLKLMLPAKLQSKQRRKWKKVGGGGVKHEALQRIEQAVNDHEDVHADLHSLGLDLSDSEEEQANKSSTGDSGLYQHHWLSNTIDYMQREEKILQLKNELHRRLGQVIQNIDIEKKRDSLEKPLQKSLLQAAKEVPSHTALVLDPQLYKTHNKGKRCDKLLLRKRRCGVTGCEKIALPCTSYCALHILRCEDQRLFCACAAVTPTQAVCHRPALPIYAHAPLCFTHKAVLGMNSPQEVPRPPGAPKPPSSSLGAPPPSSMATGTPTFRVPPAPSRKPPKPRVKKPPAPAGPKPPRVSRSKKKTPPAPPPPPRGVKNHLAHQKTPPGVVNHTLAPVASLARSRALHPHTQVLKNIAPPPPLYTLPPSVPATIPASSSHHHVGHHSASSTAASPSGNTATTVHHYADLGNDEQVSEAVLAIASMDPEELANRASRLLEEHESLSGSEFSDLFSVEEVSEEVLSISPQDHAELSNQATHLLEHEDITTVLNHLPPDAFDLFSEDKTSDDDELHRALVLSSGDVKDLAGTAVDRLFTYLDESEGSPLHPTLLFSAAGVGYPPNGYHSAATPTPPPAPEMRHS